MQSRYMAAAARQPRRRFAGIVNSCLPRQKEEYSEGGYQKSTNGVSLARARATTDSESPCAARRVLKIFAPLDPAEMHFDTFQARLRALCRE